MKEISVSPLLLLLLYDSPHEYYYLDLGVEDNRDKGSITRPRPSNRRARFGGSLTTPMEESRLHRDVNLHTRNT